MGRQLNILPLHHLSKYGDRKDVEQDLTLSTLLFNIANVHIMVYLTHFKDKLKCICETNWNNCALKIPSNVYDTLLGATINTYGFLFQVFSAFQKAI